jgi:subtilisin family serine protease/outer membrane protein assembly factor BamB
VTRPARPHPLRALRLLAILLALAPRAHASPIPGGLALAARELSQGYRDSVVIAKPKASALASIDAAERSEGLHLRARYARFGSLRVIGLAKGDSVRAAVARLMATGRYEYVEPDFVRRPVKAPDDPQFGSQWALHNDGSDGGIAGADIDAEDAWNIRTGAGSGVIIGILDSGALTTHEDLEANLWQNPNPPAAVRYDTVSDYSGEPTTVTLTDSANGLNAVAGYGLPTDDLGHGTHVSGIAGAVGNNGIGVCGVNWTAQLMELKFISASGGGTTSDELPCIEYAVQHKVAVLNASFGANSFSQAEMDAIYAAGQAGIVFVCAAGNSTENIDISPFFPADYPLDNIICVGATDNRDLPAYFSNYGSGSVELFAPGDSVLSTFNTGPTAYMVESGTSMAAPFVTGSVALLKAQFPNDTYRETINRVLNCAEALPALAGKSQTGGRLDLYAALATAASTPPNALFANRTVLAGPDPYTRSNNADTPLTPEAGTPVLAAGAGHSLWWQWTAPENATVEIDTSGTGGGQVTGGSSYATALGVYTGSGLGSLATVATSLDFGTEPVEGGGRQSYSEVTFQAAAGTTYQINVQGQGGASGLTVLSINTTPANDSVSSPAVLAGPSASVLGANVNASLQPGEPRILGNAGGHSLWYSWTAPASGPVGVSGYSYDFQPEVAVYTYAGSAPVFSQLSLVTAEEGAAIAGTTTAASGCTCSFPATAGTTYLICIDGVTSEDTGEFTLTVVDSLWQATTGDAVTCSASVAPDGTVYIGSNDNNLYAYSASGTLKWSIGGQSIFDTSSAAIAPDGTVYAGNLDGNLYAVSPSGTIRWIFPISGAAGSSSTGNYITSSVSLGRDGTLYLHGSDGNLYAVTPGGSQKWTAAVPGVSYAAPTLLPDGTVCIGSDGGTFYAFNPDGTPKWSYTTPVAGEQIYTAAAADASGNVYFGTLSGNVYSLDPSGHLRWAYAAGNGITSAPALANGSVYFGCYDGNLYALTTAGALEWTCPVGAQVRASAPAVDQAGNVYIGSYDHNVYEVGASGAVVRTFATGDVIRSSPVISGGHLCFGSEDHKVYAFETGAAPASSDWPMYQNNALRLGRALDLVITAQPASLSVSPGSGFTLAVGTQGAGPFTYQWSLNGVPIAGAVDSAYWVASASAANAGSYAVTVSAGALSATSAAATVSVGSSGPAPGRIVNLSARSSVGTGGNILIAGFEAKGQGTKSLVLRGIGPQLASFGVTGALAAPTLALYDSAAPPNLITQDTGWQNPPSAPSGPPWAGAVSPVDATGADFTQIGAFQLPSGSADSALKVSLPAGAYTSQVSGVGATTGVALAEIYDDDQGTPTASLTNISARAYVGTGSNILIAGFVIEGGQPVTVLLRGVGPTLAGFGITQAIIPQPEIELYTSGSAPALIQSNTGWESDPTLAAAFASVGAFAYSSAEDCAMIVTLQPGAYTVELVGQGGATGIGLVEVYLMP